VVGARLEQTVFQAGRFDRFVEHIRLFRLAAPERGHGGAGVLACFHCGDDVIDVVRRVGGDEDRFDLVVGNHFFERVVGFFAPARFGEPVAPFGDEVGYSDDVDVRMILEPELRAELARAVPGDSDPDLAVADRVPDLGFVNVGFCLVEPLNIRLILSVRIGGGRHRAERP
jgi:hypothetical protein